MPRTSTSRTGEPLNIGLPTPPSSPTASDRQVTVRRKPGKRALQDHHTHSSYAAEYRYGIVYPKSLTTPDEPRSSHLKQPRSAKQVVIAQHGRLFGKFGLDGSPSTPPGSLPTDSDTDTDAFPFPLQPIPLLNKTELPREPKRRCVSANALPLTPPSTPDRFIATRTVSHDASSSFRVGKLADQLTSTERLLRQSSVTPDPFRSPSMARQGRPRISNSQSRRIASG